MPGHKPPKFPRQPTPGKGPTERAPDKPHGPTRFPDSPKPQRRDGADRDNHSDRRGG